MKKLFFSIVAVLFSLLIFGQNPEKNIKNPEKVKNTLGSANEFLSGRILIEIKETSYYNPVKNGRRRVVQKETIISSGFYGKISKSRVKIYQAKPSERLKCEAYTNCPVFNGSSKFILNRDSNTMKIIESKEFPLQVTTKYLEQDFRWVKNQEKYVVIASQSASGINDLEGINIEIKPYKPANNSEGATLAPLKPSYVLWITGGRDWKLTDEPLKNGTNLRWDDFKEQLKPVNESISIGIPYEINSPEKPQENGENRYQQLLWHDVKGFDEFLLNPIMDYGITASGNRYYKDEYSETKVNVTVSLSLGVAIQLPKLKPTDEIDVTPLEPLEEEINLTPLKPIKD
jgi:hypothetical protein